MREWENERSLSRASLIANTHFRCLHFITWGIPLCLSKRKWSPSAPLQVQEKSPKILCQLTFCYPNSLQQPTHRLHKTPDSCGTSPLSPFCWEHLEDAGSVGSGRSSPHLQPPQAIAEPSKEDTTSSERPFYETLFLLCHSTWPIRPHPRGRHDTPSYRPPGTFSPAKKHKPTETHVSLCSLRGVAMGTRLSKSCLDYMIAKCNLRGISKQSLKRIFTQGSLTRSAINRCTEI